MKQVLGLNGGYGVNFNKGIWGELMEIMVFSLGLNGWVPLRGVDEGEGNSRPKE